ELLRSIRCADLQLNRVHIRVHVRYEEILPSVLIEIEELESHRAPRRTPKSLPGDIRKYFTGVVLVIGVLSRHRCRVHPWISSLLQITKRRIAGPFPMFQTDFLAHVPKLQSTDILVENT